MIYYPKSNSRLESRSRPSEKDKSIASEFGLDYFDGSRAHGYGGFHYNEKFWYKTVRLFAEVFSLNSSSSVLDVGCAKGFMLVDLIKCIPGIKVYGLDISQYAIENSHYMIKDRLVVGNCTNLPFLDKTFDLVISVNTIHNLNIDLCAQAVREISRVSKENTYIVVDGWDNEEEKRDLENWVLTAQTIMSTKQWEKFFCDQEYTGKFSCWKVK